MGEKMSGVKMVAVVEALEYRGMDWHDWKEKYYYLGEETDYKMDPSIAEHAIFMDAVSGLTLPCGAEELFGRFQRDGAVTVLPEDEDGACRFEKTDSGYMMTCNASGYKVDTAYTVKLMWEEEVRYLPVRQFMKAPKVSPGTARTETGYTANCRAAKEYVTGMEKLPPKKIMPFSGEETGLYIGSASEFDGNDWYEAQQTLARVLGNDPNVYWETYSPFTTIHEQRLAEKGVAV